MKYTNQLPTASFFIPNGWETTLCKGASSNSNYKQLTYNINILSLFAKISALLSFFNQVLQFSSVISTEVETTDNDPSAFGGSHTTKPKDYIHTDIKTLHLQNTIN